MSVLATVAQALADRDGWGHMDGWGGGWMWLWGSVMMLSWVVIVVGAVWLFSRSGNRRPTRARELLDERYARGELSTEEYRERLQHLG